VAAAGLLGKNKRGLEDWKSTKATKNIGDFDGTCWDLKGFDRNSKQKSRI
jgi:hypothetical protein